MGHYHPLLYALALGIVFNLVVVNSQPDIPNQDKCSDWVCIDSYTPVCGSDGRTYNNYCSLNREQTCSDANLTKAYIGACNSGADNCSNWICFEIYAAVCGSDGKTYGNGCYLAKEQACSNANLTKAHDGECDPIADCVGACTREYAPVCGSDGVTYPNKCSFDEHVRCIDPSLVQVSVGHCDAAPSVLKPGWCPPYAHSYGESGVNCSRIELETACKSDRDDSDCPGNEKCCFNQSCVAMYYFCTAPSAEPADCLDGYYGLSLKHGEDASTGDEDDFCPGRCYCTNGDMRCAVPSCMMPGYSVLFSIIMLFVLIGVMISLWCCLSHIFRKRRTPERFMSKEIIVNGEEKPPTYDEAIAITQSPTVSVTLAPIETPPSSPVRLI